MDIDSTQIQEITPKGITYLDPCGQQRFIDFDNCFNTYLKWERLSFRAAQPKAERKHISVMKCVGEVNYLEDRMEVLLGQDTGFAQPYVAFYDDQITSIVFSRQEDCAEFHLRLLGMGWSLFELTN